MTMPVVTRLASDGGVAGIAARCEEGCFITSLALDVKRNHPVPDEDVAAVAAGHDVLVVGAAEGDALHRLRVSVTCEHKKPIW